MHMRTQINRHENYVKNYAATEVFINKCSTREIQKMLIHLYACCCLCHYLFLW